MNIIVVGGLTSMSAYIITSLPIIKSSLCIPFRLSISAVKFDEELKKSRIENLELSKEKAKLSQEKTVNEIISKSLFALHPHLSR